MKTMNGALSALSLSLVFLLSPSLHATTHQPEVLNEIIEKTQEASFKGLKPVVVFDLDDTLINTRERNLRIISAFISQSDVKARYGEEVQKISALTLSDIKYLLADTLKSKGVVNSDFLKEASDFWLDRFFSNEYCSSDKPTPGAAKYLHDLIKAGAKIVYLTGRDIPRMEQGTRINLKRNFFPMLSEHTELLMKPDPKIDDLAFKKEALAQIKEMGDVAAVFENEPANLNALSEFFPNATAVFLDSIHSPKPDQPNPKATWISDFISN
jgi:beta-phosphoglucomutase-like phosphatase (HAD superfamily)